jgi:hypothetical protein
VLSPHDLVFLLIKNKKNYKAKFFTNLILKKNQKKNFRMKKKPIRKNIVAIDNILRGKIQCFFQSNRQRKIKKKIIKKPFR